MSLGFRVGVPGVGIRVSTRGVRASVGPRVARVHVGTGRTSVSTGLGPFFASAALRGGTASRRPSGSRSRGGVSPSRLAAEQRAAERAQAEAERLASMRALQASLQELVTVHRGSWPAASRPVIERLKVVDREAVVKHVRAYCLQGIGLLQRQKRREAADRAELLAQQYIDDENLRLEGERDQVQAQADGWWRQLLDNDEDTVCGVLNAAFADNPAGGVAVGVDGGTASIVIRQLDLGALPTHRPDLTPTGRPTLKKLNQRDRHALFLDSLTSNVAATLREAFAVAPGLNGITVCALTRSQRTQQVGPVLLGHWNRQAVDAVRWGNEGDARELVFDRHRDLHLDRTATGEARRLSAHALPALNDVMALLGDDQADDQDDDAVVPSSEAPVLRPRSFEEWLRAQGALGSSSLS